MPFARYFCIFINVGLGEAAKRDVGTVRKSDTGYVSLEKKSEF